MFSLIESFLQEGNIFIAFISIIILFFVLVIIFKGIKIVPEGYVLIIQRLGKYKNTLHSGFHIINPIFDEGLPLVTLKELVKDFEPQPVITKDNATMMIDTVVYYQITDPKLYVYGIEDATAAISNLTATSLRNIIGDLTVDQTLTSRDTINGKMRMSLDEATDAWGIKVNRVELKSIIPPKDIREAMEKEMKAERVKRATVLEAQAKKESAILIAEGEKQAAILQAEAEKQVKITEAQGEAEATLAIKQAESESIKLLNENLPKEEILKLKALETLAKVANGQATKIIVPSELQDLTSIVNVFKNVK